MKEICTLLVELHIIFSRMQRVNQHARPSIIQVGCPTCCYQVCTGPCKCGYCRPGLKLWDFPGGLYIVMLNPIFWKKVQGQKHPGRWGIVKHQTPSIKVLFKTTSKGHKHPSIRLLSKSKTQLVNQRKQKVAFSPGTAPHQTGNVPLTFPEGYNQVSR